jgi:hypothetical protein
MTEPDYLADYLDRATLAHRWRVSPRTIFNYESEPNGLPSLMLGGKKRYPWRDALEWLERRVKRPNPKRAA